MVQDNTPILVGAGMIVQKQKDVSKALSPLQLLVEAGQNAVADAGAPDLLAQIDTFASVRFVTDSPEGRNVPYGCYSNPALSVARRMGVEPQQALLAPTGGNTPQLMINELSERIARGAVELALLVGGEGLGTLMRALAQGVDYSNDPAWVDNPDGVLEQIGEEKSGCLPVETRHNLFYPVNYYPVLENALRHHLGRDMATHNQKLGALMAPFTEIAAQNPYSWFPVARSAEEICKVTDDNRLVGYPYTKYMNSVIRIDQAGALVLTSVGKARELGIDEKKWVYLHGCADANETWFVAQRSDLHRSHAMHKMTKQALNMAGWSIDDIDYFDLYSCFPVAVEVACREMGIAENDPRPFTVTGGLPYFGGAGNAYTLMSVAAMVHKLRAKPQSKGLCNGNGWFLTKHSLGLYSTTPFEGSWQRENPAKLQAEIDALPKLQVEDSSSGEGVIESYTVTHSAKRDSQAAKRDSQGLLVGRMAQSGQRFVGFMSAEGNHIARLMQEDCIGLKGTLTPQDDGTNIFVPQN